MASSSTPTSTMSTPPTPLPPVKNLILDAGPLLSLTPLRGLASRFITVPQVLAELRDAKAREHWERLKLLQDVEVIVREPDAISMSRTLAWAKHTGDIAVLSQADLSVIALSYALEVEENGLARVRPLPGSSHPTSIPPTPSSSSLTPLPSAPSTSASTSTPTPATQAPKKNPWGAIPKVQAANLAELPVEEDMDGEVVDLEGQYEDEDGNVDVEGLRERVARMVDGVESDSASEDGEEGEGYGSGEEELEMVEEKEVEDAQPPAAAAEPPTTTTLSTPPPSAPTAPPVELEPLYQDAEVSDDSDGEWITPTNVANKKAIDMGLAPPTLPSAPGATSSSTTSPTNPTSSSFEPNGADAEGFTPALSNKQKKKLAKKAESAKRAPNHKMKAACMTGDYAVQNVVLQMGLNLVGEGGKRIEVVKSWVLRCHACFKVCKDPSKKFCPSCGNASLIRASVTTSLSPAGTAEQTVHLKSNFQYRTRGTKYSIPDPKMGRAKGQQKGGSGLILREDQKEYQDGVRREEIRQQKEERKLERAVRLQEEGKGGGTGSWNDPDWLPEILTVGMSGKGRHGGGEMLPQIGHGRRNPNQVRKTKK